MTNEHWLESLLRIYGKGVIFEDCTEAIMVGNLEFQNTYTKARWNNLPVGQYFPDKMGLTWYEDLMGKRIHD